MTWVPLGWKSNIVHCWWEEKKYYYRVFVGGDCVGNLGKKGGHVWMDLG